MSKKGFPCYNDGTAHVYRRKGTLNEFSAPRNVSTLDDLEFVVKLHFEEATKREQDLDFAEQHGFSLSLKIRTRYFPTVDNKCKVVVDNYLYDVVYVDKSRSEMWLYLEGVRSLVPTGD